jgi:TPP-dependent indolepyruvate ferredoxin oxidoreductase alpha subunit
MGEYRVKRSNPEIPKGVEAHDDDILEHYLNFGMKDTTKRLSVSKDRVKQVVLAFKKDIKDDGNGICDDCPNKTSYGFRGIQLCNCIHIERVKYPK